MRNRAWLVLLGILVLMVISGWLISWLIIGDIGHDNRALQATVRAVYLTNTAVAAEFDLCDVIASTLKISHVCGYWIDGWTLTPSPTDPLLPTTNQIETTRTANQSTRRAHDTVLAACATLKVSRPNSNIDPCPFFWATSTAAAEQNTIPANTPTPSVR